MNGNKYDRSISLICPTCGGDQFEYDESSGDAVEVLTCDSCERVFSKQELINENSENVQEHANEIAHEVKKDFEKRIKDIFKGNKNFKIK